MTSAIIAAKNDHGARRDITDDEIKMSVNSAWELIKQIPFVQSALTLPNVEKPLRATRMLAVMLCPAPERHREVVTYCLHPLTGEVFTPLTKQRVEQALPPDWLS